MKLSNAIRIWEILHTKDTGEIGFCDLESAIEEVAGIENDIDSSIGAKKVEVCFTQSSPNPQD